MILITSHLVTVTVTKYFLKVHALLIPVHFIRLLLILQKIIVKGSTDFNKISYIIIIIKTDKTLVALFFLNELTLFKFFHNWPIYWARMHGYRLCAVLIIIIIIIIYSFIKMQHTRPVG